MANHAALILYLFLCQESVALKMSCYTCFSLINCTVSIHTLCHVGNEPCALAEEAENVHGGSSNLAGRTDLKGYPKLVS
jgi:hypothetical protein